GAPELCGVVIEAEPKTQPGVGLDTLGINGARLTTPLAWNEASWTSELARRRLPGARAHRSSPHKRAYPPRPRRPQGGRSSRRMRLLGHLLHDGREGL